VHYEANLKRHQVIPVSVAAGLIQWVLDCETLHYHIICYLRKKCMMDELQHRALPRVAARFEQVLLLQNMVSFKAMLELIDCSNLERA
jgi:hypothetical protein